MRASICQGDDAISPLGPSQGQTRLIGPLHLGFDADGRVPLAKAAGTSLQTLTPQICVILIR
jgi:hypothetical protein